jgi:hypothetical protein
MRKLYENIYIFHFQKRIVSVKTIRGNAISKAFSLTKIVLFNFLVLSYVEDGINKEGGQIFVIK